jgi:hypothetical protein
VTFGLDIVPNTALAASLLTWSGAAPAANNLTATVPATFVDGPTPVYASGCSTSTPPYDVWIFWGGVTYNFSLPLMSIDKLTFPSAVPGPNNAAGPVSGPGTLNGVAYYMAFNKVEIIGYLSPSGIGNVVGGIFSITFFSQPVDSWKKDTEGV